MDPLPKKWIKPEDIPWLIEFIDSKESCRTAFTLYSAFFPTKLSTVGDEAMRMIEGFREGLYPPMSLIYPNYISDEKREEILKWWDVWSKQNNLQK